MAPCVGRATPAARGCGPLCQNPPNARITASAFCRQVSAPHARPRLPPAALRHPAQSLSARCPVALQVIQAAICPERKLGDDTLSAVASITNTYVSNDLQVGGACVLPVY